MYCPSCENLMDKNAKYCGKCGMFLSRKSEKLEHLSADFAWIWRRSWAGFTAGFFGWIIVFIMSRMIGGDISPMMNNIFGGMICGVFLGTVGGIVEESAYKAFLGGVLGTIGGAIGGALNIPVTGILEGFIYAYPLSIFITWAIGGAFVGAASGVIEKNRKKIIAGALFGFVGGALGGLLGSIYYGSILVEFRPESWLLNRFIEGSSGGVVGAVLWFFVGTVEKTYIFHRRQESNIEKKICDGCKTDNPLYYWYCTKCGKALQMSAPRQKIAITPYRGMERIVNAFRFLSWLFGVTGVVTTPVIFFVFLSQDLFLASISLVFTILFSYFMVIVFRFVADILTCLMKVSSASKPK